MAVARERIHYDKFSVIIIPPSYQTLRTYPIKEDTVVRFEVTVAARQTDGAQRAILKRTGLFFRIGSGPVQVQGPTWLSDQTEKSSKNMDIKYILGATDLVVQVRNAGNISTRWNGYVDKLEVK